MDIREINVLWCDDITFCQEKCDMRDCPRNQCNIRDHNIPHSFSVERPKDCPKGKVMPDREKVIKGLECCMKWTGEPNTATCHCSDCSYTSMDILGQRCLIDLINDALALLKEQETVEQKTGHWIYIEYYDMFMCSSCAKYSIRNDYPYCHWCGAKMEQKDGDGQ